MNNSNPSFSTLLLLLPIVGACQPRVDIARDSGVDITEEATGGSNSTETGAGGTTGGSTTMSSGSGGSSGGSGSGNESCSNVTPCGGDMAGTWDVASTCLTVNGEVDLSALGLGCTSAPATGSVQVAGRLTATSNGVVADETVVSRTEQVTLAPSCLSVTGTAVTCNAIGKVLPVLGYQSATCTSVAGDSCNCTAVVQEESGVASKSYSYCVSGNQLTLTPTIAGRTAKGSIEFAR